MESAPRRRTYGRSEPVPINDISRSCAAFGALLGSIPTLAIVIPSQEGTEVHVRVDPVSVPAVSPPCVWSGVTAAVAPVMPLLLHSSCFAVWRARSTHIDG